MPIDGRSGTFSFRSWTLWYGVVPNGPPSAPPLICVPGGPGVPHDSFEPMVPWARNRTLVFYDPTGSGRSTRAADVIWDFDLFVEELAALVAYLKLDAVHLFGSSFGGLVALAYALAQPAAVRSMTLVGTTPSMPASRRALRRQIEALPEAISKPLLEREGTPEHLRAYFQWAALHLCRVPLPIELKRAMSRANMEAYHALKGSGPIGFGGTLATFDVTHRLADVRVPALIAAGRHDALYPEIVEKMRDAMPDARLAVFDASSHMPQHEEPEAFMNTMLGFLDEIDARVAE